MLDAEKFGYELPKGVLRGERKQMSATEQRVKNFNDVLSTAMSGVRAVLDQAGLRDWPAFLIARHPENPERFIVISNPQDESGFDAKLVELHKAEASRS